MSRKVTLVTGSTSGIGRAIARSFGAEGWDVIVHGRNETIGEEVRPQGIVERQRPKPKSCKPGGNRGAVPRRQCP